MGQLIPPPCVALDSYDIIFLGAVLDVRRERSGDFVILFRVKENFRGAGGVAFKGRVPGDINASPFEKGKDYLVYAQQTMEGPVLPSCSPSKLEQRAGDHLGYLRSPDRNKTVAVGGFITGLLKPDVENLRLRIEAGETVRQVRAQLLPSRYQVSGLPPGPIAVSAVNLPAGFGIDEIVVDAVPGSCMVLHLRASEPVGRDEPLPCGSPELEEHAEKLFAAGDYAAVYEEMLRCAKEGEPEAQFAVGLLIEANDEGMMVDLPKEEREQLAVRWFRKAAAVGHEGALGTLADSYENGWLGLPQDEEHARCWRSAIQEPGKIQECLEKSGSVE